MTKTTIAAGVIAAELSASAASAQQVNYTWTGYVYVPTSDTYTFRFQYGSGVPASGVTFSLDGTAQTLATASDVYGTGVTGAHSAALPGSPTSTGYTQPGLTNVQTILAAAGSTA